MDNKKITDKEALERLKDLKVPIEEMLKTHQDKLIELKQNKAKNILGISFIQYNIEEDKKDLQALDLAIDYISKNVEEG